MSSTTAIARTLRARRPSPVSPRRRLPMRTPRNREPNPAIRQWRKRQSLRRRLPLKSLSRKAPAPLSRSGNNLPECAKDWWSDQVITHSSLPRAERSLPTRARPQSRLFVTCKLTRLREPVPLCWPFSPRAGGRKQIKASSPPRPEASRVLTCTKR